MRDNIQEIKIDYENKVIKCGNLFEIKEFVPLLDWRYVSSKCGHHVSYDKKSYVKDDKRLNRKNPGVKDRNKKVSELLGMPPTKYAHMLKGAQYKLFVKENEELIKKLCYGPFKNKYILDPHNLKKFYKNVDIIKQYKKDNQDNLLPFAFYFGEDTYTLKKRFGQSLWKDFCKNSFSRNLLLCKNTAYDKELFYFNKLSSSFLKKISISNGGRLDSPIHLLWLNNYLTKTKQLTKFPKRFSNIYNLALDTVKMAIQLEKKYFDINWSLEKLEQKHNEYSKLINAGRFPDTFIERLNGILKEYHNEKYSAYLLDTPYKINQQGIGQRHCVGSYIDYVKAGRYLVYDIKENNQTVSTLGVSVANEYEKNYKGIYVKPVKYTLSQHYGSCNSQISEDLSIFGKELINHLNKNVK